MGKLTSSVLSASHDSSSVFVDVAWGKDENVECGEDEESLKLLKLSCDMCGWFDSNEAHASLPVDELQHTDPLDGFHRGATLDIPRRGVITAYTRSTSSKTDFLSVNRLVKNTEISQALCHQWYCDICQRFNNFQSTFRTSTSLPRNSLAQPCVLVAQQASSSHLLPSVLYHHGRAPRHSSCDRQHIGRDCGL